MGAVFVVNGVTIGFVGLPEYYPWKKLISTLSKELVISR
jgi:hypothetical protein